MGCESGAATTAVEVPSRFPSQPGHRAAAFLVESASKLRHISPLKQLYLGHFNHLIVYSIFSVEKWKGNGTHQGLIKRFSLTRTEVLWLSGSVRYLLSLTQWKRRELKQNGGPVNHLSPRMQLPNICKHWKFARTAVTCSLKMADYIFKFIISLFDNSRDAEARF